VRSFSRRRVVLHGAIIFQLIGENSDNAHRELPDSRPGQKVQKVLSRFGDSHPFGDGLSLVVGRSNNRKMAGTAPHRRKKM
jgi:hypothetical protein